jgi:hypothetical protein
MRPYLLLIIIAALFFSSCSKFQCLTISSNDTKRNENNQFITENDQLKITYLFYDNYGTVNVSVFNKTSKGVQINWSRSFVIVGENPSSFFNPELKVQGELDKTSQASSVILNATTVQPQSLQFIPPYTSISHNGLSLTRGRFMGEGPYEFKKERVKVAGFSKKIKRARIAQANSPLQFRIYLTVLPEGAKAEDGLVYDNHFYVSQIIKTRSEGRAIFPAGKHADMIIMSKSTAAGGFLAITGLLGIVVLLGVVAGG